MGIWGTCFEAHYDEDGFSEMQQTDHASDVLVQSLE
jgi:hypothetical protein